MKRMSRTISTLAMLLMSLGAVSSADAVLKGFSPNGSFDGTPSTLAAGALPTWFQGQDGVAVAPCITDIAKCGLLPGDTFTGVLPMVFPTNYLGENFYFLASTNPAPIGATGITAQVVANALEYVTIDAAGNPVGPALGVSTGVFQRLRIAVTPLALPATGIWTVQHPWGTTTFDAANCRKSGLGCRITIDVPAGLAPNTFTPSLGLPAPVPAGTFTMDTFLKSTTPPVGFLGDGVTPTTFTGGTVRNSFIISGPPGTTAPITTAIITGKIIGMEVQPGLNINSGSVNVSTPTVLPAPKTITITNTTGTTLTFPALTAVPVTAGDPADFTIVTPSVAVPGLACTTVAPSATCSFDINFAPSTASPKGIRKATIALAPTAVPVPPAVIADPPPPITLNLSGALVVTLTATTSGGHGTIAMDPIGGVTFAGTAPVGTPVTFTATADPKFKVKTVVAGGTPLVGPTFPLTTGTAALAVTATFMPSGDLNGDGAFDAADALKGLRIVAGVQAPVADDKAAMIVAPLVGGTPTPVDGRVEPNIGDVLVILKRALGLVTW